MAVKFVGLRQLRRTANTWRGYDWDVQHPTHVQSSLSVPKSIHCKLALWSLSCFKKTKRNLLCSISFAFPVPFKEKVQRFVRVRVVSTCFIYVRPILCTNAFLSSGFSSIETIVKIEIFPLQWPAVSTHWPTLILGYPTNYAEVCFVAHVAVWLMHTHTDTMFECLFSNAYSSSKNT